MGSNVELRLDLPAFLIRNDGHRRSGFDDVGIEARYRFLRTRAVDFGVQLMTTLPTGTRRVAERRLQPGVVVAASIDLGESMQLVVNVGAIRASDDGQRFTQAFTAGSLRVDVSERVNAFVEAYAFNREAAGGDAHRYIAAGVVLDVGRDVAFDARIGRGIRNGDGTDWLVGFGVSRRF